jgi:hypothetical protein
MDVPKGQRIAELRREIEQIGEQNRICRSKGNHPFIAPPRCRLRCEDAAGMLQGTTRSLKQ